MCRALKVLCVAPDDATLGALKRAAVAAAWELTPGATDEAAALEQAAGERPHVLVAFGPFEHLVAVLRDRFPAIRVVADRNVPGATAVATSMGEVRERVMEASRPGGPIGR